MSNPYQRNLLGMTWTSLEMALLTDSHDSGLDLDATAARIPSRTRKAIAAKSRRLNDFEPRPSPWTYERLLRLKERRAAGISARLIAEEMGTTRNAILGKLHRMGIVTPTKIKSSNGQSVEGRARRRPYRFAPKNPKPQNEIILDLPANKSENPVALFDLAPCHCRYPVGSESPAKWFCGDQVAEGKPYCPRHCRVCYNHLELRLDPQERARRAAWWRRMAWSQQNTVTLLDVEQPFTPSGQSPVDPLESSPVSTSRAG